MQKQSIQTILRNNRALQYIGALLFLFFSILLGIGIGTVSISPVMILKIMAGSPFSKDLAEIDPMMVSIVWDIRLPRVILAGLVGASLALAGSAFQGLLRNPLADPYTLGVSSGASVGAVLVLYLGLSFFSTYTLPVLSISFGYITILAVLGFAYLVDRNVKIETIILAGIIFSSFLGSFISLIIALTGDELRQIINWLLGSVSMRGWKYIWMILPFFIAGSIFLLINSKELNVLSFGEERAQYMGVKVKQKKYFILIGASILTGAAVAVSGTIGFVGLVIPHLTRIISGNDHRHLLPLNMLIGAGFLMLADLVARTIISPTELPIGVITALIGGPVFAFILMKQRRERRG
ncbi:FecCD family ABC transporter permease [Metabacillus arenae]|uniref:Iron ABC transporter permease n=1 Tax=Metabacillus arenae TaxID=2771434 RepID=A0A926N7G2_9BACI|nr:iron ABC transporter permease [Metabacillus arenae]MBD1378712.1 iron ABC transporter permease [Metabacillus arenae]